MPFNSLELSPDGTCQVCCKIERVIHKDNGTPFQLVEDSIYDVWNSNELRNLREKFLNGVEPDECSKCWIEESTGNYSLRQQTQNNEYNISKPYLNYVSLKLSNKCNLACRICGPHLSSLWQTEFLKTNRNTSDLDYFKFVSSEKIIGSNLKTFKEWTPAFRNVLIYGGEPLINNEVLNFLDYCSEEGYASNIHLILNTNGTICNDRILNQLSHFKKVSLFLSIDDFGARFEYQRWPANWEKIKKNITRFSELTKPFEVKFYPTFSFFNILYINEILTELSKFNIPIMLTNIIHQPEVFAFHNAPNFLKATFIKKVEDTFFDNFNLDRKMDYKNIFTNSINLHPMAKFSDVNTWYETLSFHLYISDQHRNQRFEDTFPELYRLIKIALTINS
jgi:organic radical activating enzyme